MRIVMATGDGLTTARSVARRLGIDEVHGEVKPADKLALVERLQKEGRVVAMAGDGINDAPALAKADVGIAMGTGTDVAMNSAQVTLVKGDLRGIARARALSEPPSRNMKQNLGFAFVYNALGMPLAAGVLYPFTAGCCRRSSPRRPCPSAGFGRRQRASAAGCMTQRGLDRVADHAAVLGVARAVLAGSHDRARLPVARSTHDASRETAANESQDFNSIRKRVKARRRSLYRFAVQRRELRNDAAARHIDKSLLDRNTIPARSRQSPVSTAFRRSQGGKP